MEKLSGNTSFLIIHEQQSTAFELRELLIELNFKNVNLFFEVKSGMEAIRILTPDVVFLGLTFNNGLNGIDILRLIEIGQMNTRVVILSEPEEISAEVIRFSPAGYLQKPVLLKDLKNTLKKVEQQIKQDNQQPVAHTKPQPLNIIQIQSNQEVNFYLPEELIYIEADGSYSVLYLYKGRQDTICQNLGKLSEKLPTHQFIRVSRKHIVNLKYIKKYSKKDQQLLVEFNGSSAKIPTSKKYMMQILH